MDEKIASFQVNHNKLKPGIYLSRVDKVNNVSIFTYDIRMLYPNKEPVMGTEVIHTLEHLGATYLRNFQNDVPIIYFGPMGCRTGFYLITGKELNYGERLALMVRMFHWILEFKGKVPGASSKECGNYQDLNLKMAKYQARNFYKRLVSFTDSNCEYPK